MKHQEIEFLQQFRGRLMEKAANGDSQFAVSKKDRVLLNRFVDEEIDHCATVRVLLAKLEKTDLALGKWLAEKAQSLLSILSARKREDLGLTRYEMDLCIDICQLLDFITGFEAKTQRPMLDRLRMMDSGKKSRRRIPVFGSRGIRDWEFATRCFADHLGVYFNLFNHFLQTEAEMGGQALVISETEQRVSELITLLGKQIVSIEATAYQLKAWKLRCRRLETCENYN